jgi:hypothetical protein
VAFYDTAELTSLALERSLPMATAAPVQPAAPRRCIQALLVRHLLISYFIITFAFSWLVFLPGVLTYYGLLSVSPSLIGMLGIVGLLGPVLSGFVMTALTECVAGVGDLLRRIVLWRVGIQWYLFAFLGLPAVMVLRCCDPGHWPRSTSPPSRSPCPT